MNLCLECFYSFPTQRRRWVAAALLPIMILCMTGFPLPKFESKDTSERYPCEHCLCGCSSAAQCWSKCCCHTDEEKLAWAEKNNVTPPSFVVERLAESRRRGPVSAQVKSKPACASCASKTPAQPKTVPAKTCCSKPSNSGDAASSHSLPATKQQVAFTKIRLVLLDPALECRGIKAAFALIKCTCPTVREFANWHDAPTLSQRISIADETAPSIDHCPEGPVPRYL